MTSRWRQPLVVEPSVTPTTEEPSESNATSFPESNGFILASGASDLKVDTVSTSEGERVITPTQPRLRGSAGTRESSRGTTGPADTPPLSRSQRKSLIEPSV